MQRCGGGIGEVSCSLIYGVEGAVEETNKHSEVTMWWLVQLIAHCGTSAVGWDWQDVLVGCTDVSTAETTAKHTEVDRFTMVLCSFCAMRDRALIKAACGT